jgi:predicted DNA-binding transcriptional regulator AlpA
MNETLANPQAAAALQNFDHLPAAANVRLPVVAGIYGVSTPTVWRWVKLGRLPAPIRRGGVTAWNVGELRANLSAREA